MQQVSLRRKEHGSFLNLKWYLSQHWLSHHVVEVGGVLGVNNEVVFWPVLDLFLFDVQSRSQELHICVMNIVRWILCNSTN